MAFLECNFLSPSLFRTVPIRVILPTDKLFGGGAQEQRPFKTLYLLHGILGNYTDWVNNTSVQSWAEARNLAVVMPSGDNFFYVDNEKSGNFYGRFISRDLVDFTRKSFPLSDKREDTFIGGLSMGGFGSIVNALHHPETFSAVCALSSALISSEVHTHTEYTDNPFTNRGYYEAVFGDIDKVAGGKDDPDALAEGLKDSEIKPKFFLACGTEDNLFEPNRKFKDHLIKLGYEVEWQEGPGVHDWNFWSAYLQKALDWLPLGDAKEGIGSGHISD